MYASSLPMLYNFRPTTADCKKMVNRALHMVYKVTGKYGFDADTWPPG